jgi:ubiquinone/menaquinone biosynthesis C-methylase UbiE
MTAAPGLSDRVAAEEARMMEVYAHRGYATARDSWATAGHAFMLAQRDWEVLKALRELNFMPLGDRSILDVGCGTGSFLRDVMRWGADPARLVGIDLRPKPLEIARRTLPAEVELLCESATALPFPDASFDLVMQASVITSIKDPAVRAKVAAEMLRVVKPGGAILWFDFRYNNPWNPNVWGMTRKDIQDLYPGARISLRSVCLAPVFSRAIAGRFWYLAMLLTLLPPTRSHYVGVIRPA